MRQMGVEEETKKLEGGTMAERLNSQGADRGGGSSFVMGSFVCLLACVCAFVWPVNSLGQVHEPADCDYTHSVTHM